MRFASNGRVRMSCRMETHYFEGYTCRPYCQSRENRSARLCVPHARCWRGATSHLCSLAPAHAVAVVCMSLCALAAYSGARSMWHWIGDLVVPICAPPAVATGCVFHRHLIFGVGIRALCCRARDGAGVQGGSASLRASRFCAAGCPAPSEYASTRARFNPRFLSAIMACVIAGQVIDARFVIYVTGFA